MDKEAQEKIAEILIRRNRTLRAFGQNPTALHDADNILALIKELGYRKLSEKPPECENCFYKQRYQPPQLYDDDFGRITGTKRPKG